MTAKPEDIVAELLKHVVALGRQVELSDDPDAAAALTLRSLEELRTSLQHLDTGDSARDALAIVSNALVLAREQLRASGDGDDALARMQSALHADASDRDLAQRLDQSTDGAFSRYRASNEARAIEALAADARANAKRGAAQVKANVDADALLRRIRDGGPQGGTE